MVDRRAAEMTPDMARALGLLPGDDAPATPAKPERGVVSAAISQSRRAFGVPKGTHADDAYCILLALRTHGHDYLLVTPDTASFVRVTRGEHDTLWQVPIILSAKERIQLCELQTAKS